MAAPPTSQSLLAPHREAFQFWPLSTEIEQALPFIAWSLSPSPQSVYARMARSSFAMC
jgi:hypothetical protein